MNWRAIKAIMRKDLKQVFQNKMVWVPMIVVPALILIVIPVGMVLMPRFLPASELDVSDLDVMVDRMPAYLRASLAGLDLAQQFIVLMSNYMFAPMFLIVPLMVASILGGDSFAGEKERKTLEALLYTPITDSEMFVAKLLVGFVPAVVIGAASFFISGIAINLAGYPMMGRIFFPTVTWWPMVFWLGPAVSLVGLGATVLISSKAKTFMQAQQTSGILVLPIVFLMTAQISGLFFLGVGLVLLIGLLAWLLGAALIWIGAKTFSRGEIIARI